jgi:hypothetical protein
MTEEATPYLLVPRNEYKRKKGLLKAGLLQRVEAAEAEIARNPDCEDGDRWPTTDGCLDFSLTDDGLMIEYEIIDHVSKVDLIDLIDLAPSKLRRWPEESD